MLSGTFISYISICSCLLMLAFCAKSVSNSEPRQVIRVNYADDPDGVKTFEYDTEGNITMMVLGHDTIVYTYSTSKITKRYLDKKGHWDIGSDFTLDASGRVISSEVLGEDGEIISRCQFIYDQEGYLTGMDRETVRSGTQFHYNYEYKDGNLVLTKEIDEQGIVQAKYVCEYYPDMNMDQNIFLEAFSEEIFSNNRTGKMSKNRIKNTFSISKEGDTMSNLNYHYEDINDPKKIKMIQKDVFNEFEIDITYHFR